MGLKKASCPICRKKHHNVVFDVSSDAEVCFCPSCLSSLNPKEAIDDYQKYIQGLMDWANVCLFERVDTTFAFKEYANIIDSDDSIVEARFGRLLAIIAMSSVRKPAFKQAQELFISETPLYRKNATNDSYLLFLKRIFVICNRYLAKLRKKVTFNNYFFSMACLKHYLTRANEIRDFLILVDIELNWLQDKYKKENVITFKKVFDAAFIEATKCFDVDSKYIISNGTVHKFMKFDEKTKEPLFVQANYSVSTRLSKIKFPTIDKQKNYPMINDIIFRNNCIMMDFYKISWFVFGGLFLAAAIFGLVAYLTIKTNYWYIFVIIGSILLGLSIATLVLHFLTRKGIKKRRDLFGVNK